MLSEKQPLPLSNPWCPGWSDHHEDEEAPRDHCSPCLGSHPFQLGFWISELSHTMVNVAHPPELQLSNKKHSPYC